MTIDQTLLDDAFGSDSTGNTPSERARSSSRRFVRGLFQIAEDSPRATGRRLSAWEALTSYGWDILAQVAAEGDARLATGPKVAGAALRQRIDDLKLPLRSVADAADLPLTTLERVLDSDPRIPFRSYERAAQVVGLDERQLGVHPEPAGNEALTIRLRNIGDENPRLTASAVVGIAEAAWVAATQVRLETDLGLRRTPAGFEPSPNYGDRSYPAFRHGYFLAGETRKILQLNEQPIDSLRELAEETLGIPIIQTELGRQIAGVTVDTGGARAIVLNLAGHNRNVLVRRSTIAHELGHLLWDPRERLNYLRVDDYEDIDRRPQEIQDFVEQRANAFAVELLAPQRSVVDLFQKYGGPADGVAAVVQTFGLGPIAGKRHLWNALDRGIPSDSGRMSRLSDADLQRWQAAEAYTVDMHPLPRLRYSRRGRFSAVVIRAAEASLIDWDTAAQFLESDEGEVKEAASWIHDLYPAVFAASTG